MHLHFSTARGGATQIMSQVCFENASHYMQPKATAAALKYHTAIVSRLCCSCVVYLSGTPRHVRSAHRSMATH